MRGRNGTHHYYYYCRYHDPLKAGGEERRCPERNIRADELDAFVYDQVRAALLRPQVLLTGETAVSRRRKTPDDELLAKQLARLDRKIESAEAERHRLADLYKGGILGLVEVQRRAKELDARRYALQEQRQALTTEREQLAQDNRLRQRLNAFADRVKAGIDELDFEQRQKLLRLVVEEVRVQGWSVEIRLRIPLDDDSAPPPKGLSTEDRLRSLHQHLGAQLPATGPRASNQGDAKRLTRCGDGPTARPPQRPSKPSTKKEVRKRSCPFIAEEMTSLDSHPLRRSRIVKRR